MSRRVFLVKHMSYSTLWSEQPGKTVDEVIEQARKSVLDTKSSLTNCDVVEIQEVRRVHVEGVVSVVDVTEEEAEWSGPVPPEVQDAIDNSEATS